MDSRIILYFLILGLSMTTLGSSTFTDAEEDQIDDLVTEVMSCRNILGMSFALVKDGQVLMSKGYGYTTADRQTPYTADTLQTVSSLTKAFTTTLLAKILRNSNLTNSYLWDTSVRSILGDEFFFNNTQLSSCATLRDMASHRMGIPPHNQLRLQHGFDRQQLTRLIRFLEPTEGFQDSYIYSNLMYGLLARSTEMLTGASWESSMREHLLLPLGMQDVCFSNNITECKYDRATGHIYYGSMHQPISPNYHSVMAKLGGSGSINANARDMATWMKYQLSIEANTGTLLECKTPQNDIPTGYPEDYDPSQYMEGFEREHYGMGWFIGRYKDHSLVYHSGSTFGYNSLLTLVPKSGLAIFTSMNTNDKSKMARHAIHMFIMDLLLAGESELNPTNVCQTPPPWYVKATAESNPHTEDAALPYESYAGTYSNHAYGDVLIGVESGALQMSYGTEANFSLLSQGSHSFFGIPTGTVMKKIPSMTFSSGKTNTIDTLTLTSWEKRMPPVFHRNLLPAGEPAEVKPCFKGQYLQASGAGTVYLYVHRCSMLIFAGYITLISLTNSYL